MTHAQTTKTITPNIFPAKPANIQKNEKTTTFRVDVKTFTLAFDGGRFDPYNIRAGLHSKLSYCELPTRDLSDLVGATNPHWG